MATTRYTPTYDLIVVDGFRVHKHIVFYEGVAAVRAIFEGGVVRIVDMADSPSQFTDKGIVSRYIPAGEADTDESTYSR